MTAAGEGASCSTRSAWTRWTPVATTTELPGIVSRKLFQEPFAADVGASHRLAGRQRISVADLSPEDLWLLADGHCSRTQAMSLCRQRGRARAALHRSGALAGGVAVRGLGASVSVRNRARKGWIYRIFTLYCG